MTDPLTVCGIPSVSDTGEATGCWQHTYPCGHALSMPVRSGVGYVVPPPNCPLCEATATEDA